MNNNLVNLEESIGYKFNNNSLLSEALTHKSFDNNFNNERLEFLGDAVISLVVSELLILKEKTLDEGKLSIFRSKIVSRSALSKIGLKVDLDQYLKAGPALENNQNLTEIIVGNTLEAIIGAIFLDSDFEMAKKITLSILNIDFSSLMSNEQKDSKTLLQEFLQASNEALPNYVTTESDRNGSLTFISEVHLSNFNISGRGEGKSKKIAEQHAAAEALNILTKNDK